MFLQKIHHARKEQNFEAEFYSECTIHIVSKIGSDWNHGNIAEKMCSGLESEMMYYLGKPIDETGGNPCQDALDSTDVESAMEFIDTFKFDDCMKEANKEIDHALSEALGLEAAVEARFDFWCIIFQCLPSNR